MRCERFSELLDAYLDEELEGEVRAAWRGHLAECEPCRQNAVRREPTLLFATTPPPSAATAETAACVRTVRALIHQDRLESRLRRRAHRWLAAAAAIVVLLAGGLAWRMVRPGPAPAVAAQAPPAAMTPGPAPEVEIRMEQPDIRVYQFAVDDPDMAVTLVVNPAMEL